MVFRRRKPVHPGKSGLHLSSAAAGDSGQAMRGSSVTYVPIWNAGPSKNTWWCNLRYQYRQPRGVTDSAGQYEFCKRVRLCRSTGFWCAASVQLSGQVTGR